MSATTKDKLEFVFAMARHSAATLWDCQRLMQYGSTHKRLMELACERSLTHVETDKLTRIEVAMLKIAESFEANSLFQGDPRGATVKIVVPDGYTNDWGKEGICVPTS